MQGLSIASLRRLGCGSMLVASHLAGLHQPQRPVSQLISLQDFAHCACVRTAARKVYPQAVRVAAERPVVGAQAAVLQRELHPQAPAAAILSEDSSGEAQRDRIHMAEALEEARKGAAAGEVPVGAVLVFRDEIVARAHNSTMTTGDPIAHAEILCIQRAAKRLSSWRLLDAVMYSTLEPCAMCAGAMLQSRVGTLVYGARNELSGADGSWVDLLPASPQRRGLQPSSRRAHPFHPAMKVRRGVLGEESSVLLREFFRWRRQQPSFREEQVMSLQPEHSHLPAKPCCGSATT